MACGGGNPNKIGQSSWMNSGSVQWNSRREAESEEWNPIGNNISNNLEWQSQRNIPGINNNKNKRKSNASKNSSRIIEIEDAEDEFVNCNFVGNQASTNYPRTKFTMQNGVNGARKKRTTYHEPNGEGDKSSRSQTKVPWTELNQQRSCMKNLSNEVNEPVSQMPTANQILERLTEIRDYMSRVAQMIETLQKSGDHRVLEQMTKLQRKYGDLQNSEQQLVKLLDKLSKSKKGEAVKFSKLLNQLETQENDCLNDMHQPLELQAMPIRSSLDGKSQSSSDDSDNSDSDQDEFVDEKVAVSQHLNQDDSNIQGSELYHQEAKRSVLLKKVVQSQEKLKALQDQQMSLIALQRKAENQLAQAKAMRHLNPQVEGATPVDMECAAARGLQDDLESLQGRLNALKDLYDNRQRAESMGRIVEPELKMDEADLMTEMQRQELQDKLQDLQEKKRYMDNLLHELKSLQNFQSSEMINNEMFSDRIKEGVGATAVAKQTVETAQDMLQLINPDEKMTKLKEMKSRLKQLQDQLAIYKVDQGNDRDECFEHMTSNIPPASTKEQLRNQNESRGLNKRPHKKENVSREQVNELKMDNRQGVDVDDASENENWEGNEMQSQFRKLEVAKDKLCKMQDLLSALKDKRQLTDDKIGIVHKLLLESLDKDDERSSSFTSQGMSCEQIHENVAENVEEHLPKERKRRSGFLLTPQEQQLNIDQLLEESHRLLDVQEQFSMNQTHPNNIDLSLPSSKSFELIRKSEPREFPSSSRQKHNDENSRSKEDYANKNSTHKVSLVKHNEADTSNGELVTSNQEIWSEVRQQFILKEELRQKKRELEELMKKDKGKMNSRNQDNMSDNVSYSNKSDALGLSYIGTEGTTVATWGGSTQGNLDEDQEDQNSHEEIEENEAYSSEDMAISATNTTAFAARNDKRPTRAKERSAVQIDAPELNSGLEKSVSLNVATSTKSSIEFKDTRKTWDKVPLTRDTVRNWNTRSNLRRSETQNGDADESCTRTETNPQVNWQQQTTQFMQQLEQTNLLHHSIIRDQNSLATLLQQMNLHPSSEEATRPEVMQLVVHQLQHQQQLISLHQCHHLLYLQQLSMQQLQRQLQQLCTVDGLQTSDPRATNLPNSEQHSLIPPSWFSNSQLQQNSVGAGTSEIGSNLFSASFITPDQQMLNNQVAPGIRTNNYWDNFRSYSRQNLLSATSTNKTGYRDTSMMNPPIQEATLFQNAGQNRRRIPPDGVGSVATQVTGRNSEETNPIFTRHVSDTALFQPISQSSSVPLPKSKSKKKDKINENCHQENDGSGIFRTFEQSMSAKNEIQKPATNGGSCASTYVVNTASASSSAVSFDSAQEGNVRSSHEARDSDERNLFETLRESIYSEVAILISQNETRPHFLIRMFRELQKLNSDYLRQNALVSLSELISHLSTVEQTSPSSPGGRRTWVEQMSNSFELGASESIATSDEDEMRTRLSKMSKSSQKMEMPKQKMCEQQFDYSGTMDSTITASPVYSTEPGFNTSAVSENTNHIHKTKEVNQQIATSAEETANSTHDQESELNASTFSCSELTSKQLDDKIQVIMLEVIPFLKAHLDDVCSTKLLSCLQQLVISLATQRDVDVEFSNLLRKRLTSSLQAAHAKYTGKKLRECGENLLVDTSEALVAELACVHLIHNVDGSNSSRTRTKNYRCISQNFSVAGGSVEVKKENVFSNRGIFLSNFDVEATDADECLANKMEEDELGHSRDDAMATNCDTFDNEDASRTSSINSFKDSLQNETERSIKSNELIQEIPAEAIASTTGSRSESSHYQNEMVFNEVDNETEDGAEDNLDLAEADQPQNFVLLDRIDIDDQERCVDATRAEDDQEGQNQIRGAEGGMEQGLDQVPIKLMPLFQRELNNQMAEEESANNLIDEIINESVESELAENVSLRQPENQ